MSKKLWLLTGGLLDVLFLLLLISPYQVLAAEGECHLKNCLVPAPTILMPEDGDVVNTSRPAIRGLTWRRTIVKVYLDGQELTNVKQRDHEDYYASFFVMPQFDLSVGDHFIYTIAHSEKPGWFDQSQESTYINFKIQKITVAPVILPAPLSKTVNPVKELQPLLELPSAVEDPPQEPAEIILPPNKTETPNKNIYKINEEENNDGVEVIIFPDGGDVEIQKGRIEGGVSIEKETEGPTLQEAAGLSDLGEILNEEFVAKEQTDTDKRNKTIGLAMLAVILVVTIIWLVVDRKQSLKKVTMSKDEGELPPPPQPPKSRAFNEEAEKLMDEEITVEPILEEDDDLDFLSSIAETEEREYWASPPPSPYSPYPQTRNEEVVEKKEKQDDLGV